MSVFYYYLFYIWQFECGVKEEVFNKPFLFLHVSLVCVCPSQRTTPPLHHLQTSRPVSPPPPVPSLLHRWWTRATIRWETVLLHFLLLVVRNFGRVDADSKEPRALHWVHPRVQTNCPSTWVPAKQPRPAPDAAGGHRNPGTLKHPPLWECYAGRMEGWHLLVELTSGGSLTPSARHLCCDILQVLNIPLSNVRSSSPSSGLTLSHPKWMLPLSVWRRNVTSYQLVTQRMCMHPLPKHLYT